MPERTILKETYSKIYNLKNSGMSNNEVSTKCSIDYRNVVRINKIMEICDGDVDLAYSIPFVVTQKRRDYIIDWLGLNKVEKQKSTINNNENQESDEFVSVTMNKTEEWVPPVLDDTKNHIIPTGRYSKYDTRDPYKLTKNTDYNVVKHYIPDYRREISPNEISTNYEYGGIKFSVNKKEGIIIFKNLSEIISGCNTESIQFEPGEYDKTTIQTIINIGEALVGIGLFFKSQV